MLSYLLRHDGGKPVSNQADKRTVATDALATLGTIIGPDEKRDAIHLAVEPVVAAEDLRPGQHVVRNSDGTWMGADAGGKPLGIVDPFLSGKVRRGQRFWLVVYPRQITSLRHVWTHPDLPDADTSVPAALAPTADQKAASEAWLRGFVETRNCPDYDALIAAATDQHHLNADKANDPPGYDGYFNSRNDGEYLHFGGRDAHGEIPPEFWEHVEIVSGKKIPADERASYFSCSC